MVERTGVPYCTECPQATSNVHHIATLERLKPVADDHVTDGENRKTALDGVSSVTCDASGCLFSVPIRAYPVTL